jgi:group I intron endonuclease
MKKFYYVYVTTNIISGKQYVGDRSCNGDPYKDQYLGSGLNIVKAIKKYKKENFKKEILEFFDSKQDAFDGQEKYINKFNTLIPNGYNISPLGGHNAMGCLSEETKKKISESNKGKHYKNGMYGKKMSEFAKAKIKKAKTGTTLSKETKKKISESNKGKKHTEEYKKLMSEKLKGRKFSEETLKKMSNSQVGNRNCVGRAYSLETKEKISKTLRGRIPWNKGLNKK